MKNARLRAHFKFGGVDWAVKKTHPPTFSTNKINDLAELLINGNKKTATNSVATAKRNWFLSVFCHNLV